MDQVLEKINNTPLVLYGLAGIILLTLIIIILFFLVRIIKFRKKLDILAANPDLEIQGFTELYKKEFLIRKSSFIAEQSGRLNTNLPELLGLTDFWISKYKLNGNKKLENWILSYASDRALFPIFLNALHNSKSASKLEKFLDDSKDFLKLRQIALSGAGAKFDGEKALALFEHRLDEIREMTGDAEWAARYFAINILLHCEDERSQRAVWESFSDPHALVRSTVVQDIPVDAMTFESEGGGDESLYEKLYDLLLNDPVFEVRKAAKTRIQDDFAEKYSLNVDSLSNEQILHLIQLLSPESTEDQDLAVQVLGADDLELRQSAARFLQSCHVLERLFKESYMNDTTQLERNSELLHKALDVNVAGFLTGIQSSNNRGSLLIASRILQKAGPQESISKLADRVFAQDLIKKVDVELNELYTNTIQCIYKRGNDQSIALMTQEMMDIRNHPELLKIILQALPVRGAFLFLPVLEEFLKDPDFPLKEELRETLLQMPEADVLEMVMDIIHKGRSAYSHQVRIQALKILGGMKNESCLQIILENLPILPLDEAREFASLLSSYAEDLFNERVKSILNSIDAQSRAAIIVSLPATGKKTFLKEIRASLNDANPEVRIASIWALVEYKEYKELARCVDMLRDPVERVRVELAKALGASGPAAVLKELEKVLNDKNEVESVILGIIEGLGAAESSDAVEILVRKLAYDDEYKSLCIRNLSRKKEKKSITTMVELFKDAGPQLREDMSSIFKIMGYAGEKTMVELLKEDIPSLHRYIAEILESSGFVENNIRKLKDRDFKVRVEAASFLAAVRTKAAFRGIVQAARDPNQDVRVEVTKALEVLNTEEGTEILKDLEQDPDKKVRKYTFWALERIRTKSLD